MRDQITTGKKLTDSHRECISTFKNYVIHRHGKTRYIYPVLLASATWILSSCSHYYYVQGVHNVPLFKEKNEFRISGTYGEGKESKAFEIQAAYSVTDNIGILTDYMSAHGGDVSDQNYGNGNYFDGAIGYYKPAGNVGVFEIYGGLGRGKQHHEYNLTSGTADISFTKLYIQPSFGITFKLFDIALSTRISRLSFNNLENKISGNTQLYNTIETLSDKNHIFFEPAITLRGGWKYVKLQIQAAYSGYLNNPELYIGEEYHLSIGLYCALGKRFR
jgi:hypothetical protein